MREGVLDAGDNPALPEYLAPGIVADDLPALFPLLAARPLLAAFTALFHGGEDGVIARLLVLREIGMRGTNPHWSPQELESHFAYLDPARGAEACDCPDRVRSRSRRHSHRNHCRGCVASAGLRLVALADG
jgi:hypothetical protein